MQFLKKLFRRKKNPHPKSKVRCACCGAPYIHVVAVMKDMSRQDGFCSACAAKIWGPDFEEHVSSVVDLSEHVH